MTALDPSSIVPLRAVDRPLKSWRAGLLAGSAEGLVSLLFNLAVVALLVRWAFPRDLPRAEQHTIAVDIVEEAAKPDKASEATGKQTPAPPPAPTQERVGTSPQPPAPPPAPASQPTPSPADPATDKTATSQGAKAPANAPENAPPADVPPPIEAGGQDDKPQLLAAPPDPRQGAQQADTSLAANAETETAAAAKPVERPPPPSPEVLAAPGGGEVLPDPVRTADPQAPPAPPSAEQQREAENTAKLAAALPFNQLPLPDLPRAPLTGSGASNGEYRGAVYGSFSKADDLMEAAQAKHLRGQAVVVFSIDDAGALTSIKIGVSSGNPAVDQTALDIIKQSAPFPPPPPGAQKTFAPAIRLGLDQ